MVRQHWRGPVVGVLGGMGPASTVTFLDALVRLTDAASDQDHIDAVVLQHSTVPDRTAAILRGGASPGPVLAADARLLAGLGVDLITLPCNSAHAFIDEIGAGLDVDILSIVDITAARAVEVARRQGGGTAPQVAIFATEGTIAAGTYDSALRECGAVPWLPPPRTQAAITAVIYDQVKAGQPVDVESLGRCVDEALAATCTAVVLGCTELSVAYAQEDSLAGRPHVVDSTRSLAVATIERAGRTVRADP